MFPDKFVMMNHVSSGFGSESELLRSLVVANGMTFTKDNLADEALLWLSVGEFLLIGTRLGCSALAAPVTTKLDDCCELTQ